MMRHFFLAGGGGYEWWLDEEGDSLLVDGDLEGGFSVVCWNEKGSKFLLSFITRWICWLWYQML